MQWLVYPPPDVTIRTHHLPAECVYARRANTCAISELVTAALMKMPYFRMSYRKGKSKTIPFQAWTGLEASRRLRLPDFKSFGT